MTNSRPEGGIERNFSLTVTAVTSSDLGQYSCVAINNGGMAERNVTLTFTDPRYSTVQYSTVEYSAVQTMTMLPMFSNCWISP